MSLTGATTVANKHQLAKEYPGWRTDKNFEWIGYRAGEDYHYGNPFLPDKDTPIGALITSRADSMLAFDDWLDGSRFPDVEPERRRWILNNLWRLEGKTLVCSCHPQPCHGNVYVRRLES